MRYLMVFFSILLFADVGTIKEIKGDVNISRNRHMIKASLNMGVDINDTVITYKNSKAKIVFKDNTIITIGQNSAFKIKDYVLGKKPKARFGFLKGTFISVTGKIGKIAPKRFKLETKNSSIGIRGTIVFGQLYLAGDIIGCSQGLISVANGGKSVLVKPGEIVGSFGNAITAPFRVASGYVGNIIKSMSLNPKEIVGFFGLIYHSDKVKKSNSKSKNIKIKNKNINVNETNTTQLTWKDYFIEKSRNIKNREFEPLMFDNELFFQNFKYKE